MIKLDKPAITKIDTADDKDLQAHDYKSGRRCGHYPFQVLVQGR